MGKVERANFAKTITFRWGSAYVDELRLEAEKRGISVNTLTERIIEQYINLLKAADWTIQPEENYQINR